MIREIESLNNEKGATSVALYRYALCVEYAGARYNGWQIQKNDEVPTVQGHVQKALSVVANEPVAVVCAGRTDAGVNGTYQIIHFDSHAKRENRAWVLGGNTNLPDDIAIRWAVPVDDTFHARFSALERRYRYLIYSHKVKPALLTKGITWTYKPLNIEKMKLAATYLVGKHDFSSYRAVACQASSPVRDVKELNVYQSGDLIVIDVRANAFLHHMIRNIAGVLMTIGAGEALPVWAKEVLEAKNRCAGGITAPSAGLYFVDVKYPDTYSLPKSELGPYFVNITG
ncbi:tRNA pseudouridine(38-40) synthase TruA [Neptunomonas qingdaonensis]|uniref:tRNA pseudouridine synthase A n=1 Tax=Neptunomonas qingdaonensis TaxID=1045558 RepID=A0A1I2UX90_9GAMM|nr:tRNA pseudouridine(38-40) synthase TruA [Neptunomonas qingdaonensis]SFG81724.1 tRNA pseudouridine38-40 synthase [Neptunomonas qingdaonensis]